VALLFWVVKRTAIFRKKPYNQNVVATFSWSQGIKDGWQIPVARFQASLSFLDHSCLTQKTEANITNFFHLVSRIRIKDFKCFKPKNLFLSSRKYDPGCSSRIRILFLYPSRIPDPGVKKAPDPGSATLVVDASVQWVSGSSILGQCGFGFGS
jgi:hypothetical protein